MRSRFLILLFAALACGSPQGPPVQVLIPARATLASAADTLVAHGLLDSPRLFRWYARFRGKSGAIKAGVYEISPGLSAPALVRMLTAGHAALQRLVVPEGLMMSEIAATVAEQIGVSADAFLAAARDPAVIARVAPGASSVEGYLYPSTYLVRYGVTAPEVVQQMLAEFNAHWHNEWNSRLDSLHLTRHQLLTLASIIEGEVKYSPDRAYVSSVYHNRLRRHMRLQADPTVIYALGERRRLFEKDYLR